MDWLLGIHALMLLKLPVKVVMVGANLQKEKIDKRKTIQFLNGVCNGDWILRDNAEKAL